MPINLAKIRNASKVWRVVEIDSKGLRRAWF